MPSPVLQIRFPAEVVLQLKGQAEKEKLTVSELIRKMVDFYFDESYEPVRDPEPWTREKVEAYKRDVLGHGAFVGLPVKGEISVSQAKPPVMGMSNVALREADKPEEVMPSALQRSDEHREAGLPVTGEAHAEVPPIGMAESSPKQITALMRTQVEKSPIPCRCGGRIFQMGHRSGKCSRCSRPLPI